MSPYQPRIAIVGGGPVGLTLGVLLHKRGIPFTIFELRTKPSEEELSQPSGMLDLHEESGLSVIRELDLLQEFNSRTGECGESQIIADKDGHIIFANDGASATRPEISRHALADLLLSNLPPETIKWDHKLGSASNLSASRNAETELDFGADNKQTFDLVIGADGAWSRVRNLLTDVKPKYEGMQCITTTIRQVTKKYPQLSEHLGPGTFTALGLKHGVISQRASQNSVRIYVLLSTADEHFGTTSGVASQSAAGTKDKILSDDALLGRWGGKIKELVSVACDEESKDNPGAKVDLKGVYMLPIGHTWEHKPGVTLVGDASHLMRPSGEGVNLGMQDSLLLYKAIIKAVEATPSDAASFQSALGPLIRDFEVDMWERAKVMADDAREMGEIMFGTEDGATVMTEWFKGIIEQMSAGAQDEG